MKDDDFQVPGQSRMKKHAEVTAFNVWSANMLPWNSLNRGRGGGGEVGGGAEGGREGV